MSTQSINLLGDLEDVPVTDMSKLPEEVKDAMKEGGDLEWQTPQGETVTAAMVPDVPDNPSKEKRKWDAAMEEAKFSAVELDKAMHNVLNTVESFWAYMPERSINDPNWDLDDNYTGTMIHNPTTLEDSFNNALHHAYVAMQRLEDARWKRYS